VRLSEFHGKTVLLNFWTTWCPSCLVEIPSLIELQRRHPDELRVIGISLDGQTEDDGHGHSPGPADGHFDIDDIRRKVANFVQTHGINYQVLLDPTASVSPRFNGNELPTNALLDSKGLVRKRFLGGRSVDTFEAMLRECRIK
jgi:thiol-disulfide isomerase/thioredoxin